MWKEIILLKLKKTHHQLFILPQDYGQYLCTLKGDLFLSWIEELLPSMLGF
jgi:hypothetical protein